MKVGKAAEILLVDDNESDRELALHALKSGRVANTIHIARDGAEALDFIFARGAFEYRRTYDLPHVILLDLKLPRISGVEVLKNLKSEPRTQMIPVIMLTSSQEDSDIAVCYRLGVNSYIVKPVDFQQFTERLSSIGMYWMAFNQPPPIGRIDGGI